MPPIGLHTLRHSAASVMLTNAVPLKVVSEMLGQLEHRHHRRHLRARLPRCGRDALAKLARALDGLAG
jgi:integrase